MSSKGVSRKHINKKLIERVMLAGRDNGARAILFHQAIAHVLNLNATDTRCLDVIVRSGPSSPSELARLTGLTTGAITTLIDRLERAKLIERKSDALDRRKTVLIPTGKAMKCLGPLFRPMAANMFKFLSQFSQKELGFLEDFFTASTEFWKNETLKVLRISNRT